MTGNIGKVTTKTINNIVPITKSGIDKIIRVIVDKILSIFLSLFAA